MDRELQWNQDPGDADLRQRDWIAQLLARCKQQLERVARTMVDAGRIDQLPELERLRGRMDRLIARIRGSLPVGGAWYDRVGYSQERLAAVRERDLKLMDQIAEFADRVECQASAPPDSFGPLLEDLEQLHLAWEGRCDLLSGRDLAT